MAGFAPHSARELLRQLLMKAYMVLGSSQISHMQDMHLNLCTTSPSPKHEMYKVDYNLKLAPPLFLFPLETHNLPA